MAKIEGQEKQQQDVIEPNLNCSSTEEEELPYPALAPVVFHIFHQTTRPRNWCLRVACSPWLDFVSELIVLLNCVILSIYNTYDTEVFFFAFFIIEMLMKMMALGIFGYDGSYLRNNWYRFDVFINSGEMLDYILASFGIHLKIFGTLGPMRLISREPGMRHLVTVLLQILPLLGRVLILCMFVIHIFAVVGVQLWAGQLRHRCFLGDNLTTYNVSLNPFYVSKYGEKIPFICSPDHNNGMLRCHNVPPYRKDGKTCSLPASHPASAVHELVPTVASANACVNWNMFYNVCRVGDLNPQMGAISFDSIGFSWIAMFQVITLEGWSQIMSFVMDAYSFWCFPFFILVTIMGSFIMMNVCAVLIATKFSEKMYTDAEQSAGAVSIIGLLKKITCWVFVIFYKIYRRHQTVHPYPHPDSTSNPKLVQAWMTKDLKRKLKETVDSELFNRAIMFAVFLSVLTMAIEHHKQAEEITRVLNIINITLVIVFFVEMVVKLLSLSWSYFKDRNNVFDFAIVIISLWELVSKADGKLSVLRAFRVLRFVRLLHFFPYLRRQLLVLKKTIVEAAVLCKLLLFTIFIFSILGMQLFKGKFTFKTQNGDTITDRKNFDTLPWAMVTVFQILTLEDWNLVLYNAMAATSPWASLYFVALIVIGKYVLFNVVVGIVVQSFQEGRSDQASALSFDGPANSTPTSSTSAQTDNNMNNDPSRPSSDFSRSHGEPSESTAINIPPEEDPAPAETSKDNRFLNLIGKVLRWCKEHEDWSLYVLSPQNRFRVFCQRVIAYKMFDHMILFFILLSCVTLALERPGIDPTSMERRMLKTSRYVFCGLFLVEMLLKVLALGLFFGKESYCQSPWNVMDGSLVTLSVVHILISMFSAGSDMLGILKVLRLLRTLRPLRVIKRAPKLKLAVKALVASVKPIGNIFFICCTFFVFYAIFGLQLFKGKIYSCVGQDTRNITNKSECLSANYHWIRKTYNFDNLGQALMSLFVMYSKDGWVNIMHDGLDAVGVDKQPVRNYNEWMLLYFISFMILSFLLLDMFIGALVEVFYQVQQEQKETVKQLPEEEREGGEVSREESIKPEPEMPYYTYYSPLRRSVHTLCIGSFLDLFMTVIIVISALMMGLEHYKQPQYIKKLIDYFFYIFTAILIIEVLLKLVAFGLLRFIKVSWNLLDIAVVFISIICIILNEMKMAGTIPINPNILRVCRILRLAQVMKDKKIRVLLKTIIKTLSQVGNICLLFMFFFFIFAVLGVELFGKLECSEDQPCLGLNRHTNFRHFGMALLTLYQVCTGDNWSAIMKDTLRECQLKDNSCTSYLPWVSPIFFSCFVVLAQFVLVNLVVAAIMQALEDSTEEEEAHDSQQALQSSGERSHPVLSKEKDPHCL